MEKCTKGFCIRLSEFINDIDYELINKLKDICEKHDGSKLKLELDYKLKDSENAVESHEISNINEFMCFDGEKLIAYIGICSFGDHSYPLELMGMVHPDYRKQGIFSKLHQFALDECRRRNSGDFFVLCDRKSDSGKKFLASVGAKYNYSEFEMYLNEEIYGNSNIDFAGMKFRKAVNDDAREIARQNKIYFEATDDDCQDDEIKELLLPEEEEKRGMTIYIGEYDKKVVGKVNIQIGSDIGGIYGLGVLPEHRGNGFGRALLLMGIEELRKLELDSIMLQVAAENSNALNLYSSCGFRERSIMDYYILR